MVASVLSLTQRGSDSQGLKFNYAIPTFRVETSNTNTISIGVPLGFTH